MCIKKQVKGLMGIREPLFRKNWMIYRTDGEIKINDNALVALALMTAKSLPEQKDTVIALVVNMLVEGEDGVY